MSEEMDRLYEERNHLVLLAAQLARQVGYRVRVQPKDDLVLVIIELPTGQISYPMEKVKMLGEYAIDVTNKFHDSHTEAQGIENLEKFILNLARETHTHSTVSFPGD